MVYLGDLARVPYGGRSVETITRYAADDVEFLLRRDVEAVVIACGTVSSNSLETLRDRYGLPIFGVIDSAARRAAETTRTGCVGVIGTQATVKSGAFERAILSANGGVRVISRACPLIVPLVENGVPADDIVAETVCGRYLDAFRGADPDRLILGCTHYPVYRPGGGSARRVRRSGRRRKNGFLRHRAQRRLRRAGIQHRSRYGPRCDPGGPHRRMIFTRVDFVDTLRLRSASLGSQSRELAQSHAAALRSRRIWSARGLALLALWCF